MNRLGVFFFYDKDGIADRYVDYLLESMDPCLCRLVIVSNGKLTKETKAMFGKHTQMHGRETHCLIERENNGFDVWAYRTALLEEGWECLEKYDEIVLFNYTIMGPLYPFKTVFEEMEHRDVDFWGISEYFDRPDDPTGENPYGYLPTHLQSHFIVCRNSLVIDKIFQDYWEHMPEIRSYEDSVGKHESYFTKYFSDKGFRWQAYTDLSTLHKRTEYPLIDLPLSSVGQYRCPIFKRKGFFCDTIKYYEKGSGAIEAQQLFRYLKENTDYDTDMIVENMIRTCHQSDYSVYLDTLLRLDSMEKTALEPSGVKIAVIATETEAPLTENIAAEFKNCRIEILKPEKNGLTIERLLEIAENSDFVCVLNLPVVLPKEYTHYDFGFTEYRCELYQELLGEKRQNFSYLLNALSRDLLTGAIVGARLVTLDSAVIDFWKMLFQNGFLRKDTYFQEEKIPQGAGLPFFIAKGSALTKCRSKLKPEILELDLLKTGCVDLIVSLLVQQNSYLTKSILLDPVYMANTNLQTGYYTGWKTMEQTAKNEIAGYKEILANYSVMTALRIKIKRILPKGLYAFIVKAKRFFFGPHGVGYSDDENRWEISTP